MIHLTGIKEPFGFKKYHLAVKPPPATVTYRMLLLSINMIDGEIYYQNYMKNEDIRSLNHSLLEAAATPGRGGGVKSYC